MIKEFEINDILNAISIISKTNKKKIKIVEKKDSFDKNEALTINNQGKLDKSEILVLTQMIE